VKGRLALVGVAWLAVGLPAGAGGCGRFGSGSDSAEAAPSRRPPAAARSTPPADGITAKARPSPEALALSDAFADAAAAIRPSVVRLDVEETVEASSLKDADEARQSPDLPEFMRRFLGLGGKGPSRHVPVEGTGSGIIIDARGDILTNSHVVRGADKVTIKLPDQRSFPGRVIGADPLTDVAVVRFEKAPPGLVVARLGDSNKLRIGQWVIAVGSPLGMDQTVTAGIVSGVGETGGNFRFGSGERVRQYIQTDAEINPGNSGGPLVSLEGEVLGLNTLLNVGPGGGYGFAIPVAQAGEVATTLIKEGRVRYPYIGLSVVALADLPPRLLAELGGSMPREGAIVATEALGGPAVVAGLRPGDVITRIAGRPIKTGGDVVGSVSAQPIGGDAAIDYVRDGTTHSTHLKVGEVPVEPASADGRIGVALQTLTAPLARSLGLGPSIRGAVVTEVLPGSPAEEAGLAVGDAIRQIDGKPVASTDDAVAAIRSGKGRRVLRITSATGTRFVAVTPR
jgi:serine protease Do